MTLDDAVRTSLAGNLDLRAAKYEVEKARGRLIQAGLWPNPSLEIGGRTDRAFSNEGERTLSVGFAQAFPITGRLKFAKQASRVDVAQAMVEIRNRERLLIGEVQRDYLTTLLLQRQIASNREFIGVNREFVTLFEQRLKKAEVSEVEVNLARVELQRVELETLVLEADLSSRELALKQRLGIGPAGRLEVEGDVEAPRLSIRTEIATSIAQAMKLREVVGRYQTVLLPTLSGTTDLLKKGFKEGLSDTTRLVQAQQQRATLRVPAQSLRRTRHPQAHAAASVRSHRPRRRASARRAEDL